MRPKQITQEGASVDDVLTWDGSEWGPAAPTGGSSGGSTGTTDIHTPPATADAMDDEFDDRSGQSGSSNGLAAKWTRHNLTAMVDTGEAIMPGWGLLDIDASEATDQALIQPIPSGDFDFAVCATGLVIPGRQMFGLMVCTDAGNGYVLVVDNGDNCYLRNLTSWVQGSTLATPTNVNSAFFGGSRVIFEVSRVGTTYSWSLSTSDFLPHAYRTQVSVTSATAFTKVGFGRVYKDGTQAGLVGLDYARRL